MPLGIEGEGKARELGRSFWSSLIDAFPDLHVVVESVFGDERHVAAEVVIGGTQQKDFLQIPNKDRQFEVSHAFHLEISHGGKISGITAYWDFATVYSDLGKTTLP